MKKCSKETPIKTNVSKRRNAFGLNYEECPRCGTIIKETATPERDEVKYCKNCGQRLER